MVKKSVPYKISYHHVKETDTDFKLLISALVRYSVNLGHMKRPVVCDGCLHSFEYVPNRLIFDNAFWFPISAHHYCYDFNHVLDVVWLCNKCHVRVHYWLFNETIEPIVDLLKSEGCKLSSGFLRRLFWFSAWNVDMEKDVEYVML